MNYTTIEFDSSSEWLDYDIPSEGAYHFIVKDNEKIEQEFYYFNGQLHHKGGLPAVVMYYENGQIERKFWYLHGKCHREGGKPASVWYYRNGQLEMESWYLNGKYHREDGKPTEIGYDENGKTEVKGWYTSKHPISLYSDGEIGIGCKKHTPEYWLANWEAIAKEHDVSEAEIQEYRRVFDYIKTT